MGFFGWIKHRLLTNTLWSKASTNTGNIVLGTQDYCVLCGAEMQRVTDGLQPYSWEDEPPATVLVLRRCSNPSCGLHQTGELSNGNA